MAFDGNGNYSLPAAAGNPVVTGTTITATWWNQTGADLATALTTALCKDGQSTPTANIKMGGFKFTNVAAGTAVTDSARVGNVQNGTGTKLGTIAGTNTITAQATPTLTAYADGQTFRFAPAGTNTGATTLNIDSLGAKNIFYNGSALTGGEIPASGMVQVTYDGTQFNLAVNAAAGNAPFSDSLSLVKNSSDATKLSKISNANLATGVTASLLAPGLQATGAMPLGFHGQCQLQYVGTTSIKLVPFNGQYIIINGVAYAIPSAGVTLANTGLTAATKYYIYAFMNSGTMTLEASTTAYATDTTAGNVGIKIKTADSTRTLVGMVYMDAGVPGTYASTATKQWTRSYFNDPGLSGNTGLTVAKTSASATFAELDSTVRIQFIPWADEQLYGGASGVFSNATGGNPYYAALGYDGTTPADGVTGNNNANNGIPTPWALTIAPQTLSEALHYLTLLGASTGAITGTWYGAAAPTTSTPAQRCSWWLSSARRAQ